jgi:SPP1 family predicted phage head-tail adaptor
MLTILRNRVTIQSLTTTASGGGTFIETWSTVSTVWANVQGMAKEETRFDKIQQIDQYTIRMRKRTLTNENRLIYKGEVLEIESVLDETQQSKMMTIKARAEI